MNKTVVLSIVLCFSLAHAGSKALKLLPTLPEIGLFTGVINVYKKMGSMIKTTNMVIKRIQTTKQTIEHTKNEAKRLYESVQALSNINPYDMSTWSGTIHLAQVNMYTASTHAQDIFRQWDEIFEVPVLVSGTIDEVVNMHYTFNRKLDIVTRMYSLNHTYDNPVFAAAAEEANRHYASIVTSQNRLVSPFDPKSYIVQAMAESTLALNLVDCTDYEMRQAEYEEAAAEYIGSFQKLSNSRIPTHKKTDLTVPEIPISDPDGVYGPSVDQVPAPPAPTGKDQNTGPKSDPNQQDIIGFQNQIEYLLLRQECLLRDIKSQTASSLAYLVALEGYSQSNIEEESEKAAVRAGNWKHNVENMSK